MLNHVLAIVETYVHRLTGTISLAIPRHDHEAVSSRGGTEDGCSARGDGLDLVVDDSHTNVIHSAYRRHKFSSQRQLHSAVRPFHASAAQAPDCRARKEVVRGQTGDRVAREQKNGSRALILQL